MKAREAILAMFKARGYSQRAVAEKLGITAQSITCRLNGNGIRSDKLVEMCDAVDYKVILVPKDKKVSDAIELTI